MWQQLTWPTFEGGINTKWDNETLKLNQLQDLKNFQFTAKGSLVKRKGCSLVGTEVAGLTGGVTSLYPFVRQNGTVVWMKSVGVGMYALDPSDDTWKRVTEATASPIVFTTGKKFGFAQGVEGVQQSQRDLGNSGGQNTYATTFVTYVYFGNGVENCYKWDGDFTHDAAKISTTTETIGNILVFWHQRLYVAGNPLTPCRLCWSKLLQQSQTSVSFTIALGGATGDAGFKTMDAAITSAKVFINKDGTEFLKVSCANNVIYEVTISEDTTLGTQMKVEQLKQNIAEAHDACTVAVENDYVFPDLESHIRSIGYLPTKTQVDAASLSVLVDPTTEQLDFSAGSAAYSKRNVYFSGSTVEGGTVDTMLAYDTFYQGWWEYVPAYSALASYRTQLYAGSSTTPSVYLLGQGQADNTNPIYARFKTKEVNGGDLKLDPANRNESVNDTGVGRIIRCRELRLGGRMSSNCEFTVNVYFDKSTVPVQSFLCSVASGVVRRNASGSGSWGTFSYGGSRLWGGSGESEAEVAAEQDYFVRLIMNPTGDAFSISFEIINSQAGVYLDICKMSGFFELCQPEQLEPRYTLPDTLPDAV